MASIRSPNYPGLPIGEAVELARKVHAKEGRNYASREVVAQLLGYSKVNGASEKKTSALNAYGLLERNKNRELRVSELAMRAMFALDETEKIGALAEAAMSPSLFQEIRAKWPDSPPSDESLRACLIRRGFNQNSVGNVIEVFRDALRVVEASEPVSDSQPEEAEESQEAPSAMTPHRPDPHTPPPGEPVLFNMKKVWGQYSFDNAEDLAGFIDQLERLKPLLPNKH